MDRSAEIELHLAAGQFVNDVASIGHGTGQPVKLGDDEGIAGPARGERFAQAGTIMVGAGQAVVDLDPFRRDAERDECVALSGEVLRVGGAACVSDEAFSAPDEGTG